MGNAELTEHPKIFRQTYWNGHCFGSHPEIIHNRNKFVEEFQIERFVPANNPKTLKPPLRGNRFETEVNPDPSGITFDHFEMYKRKGNLGYVAIFSRYHDVTPKHKYHQEMIDLGYTKYHRHLYCMPNENMTCPTYILLVPKTKPRMKK